MKIVLILFVEVLRNLSFFVIITPISEEDETLSVVHHKTVSIYSYQVSEKMFSGLCEVTRTLFLE